MFLCQMYKNQYDSNGSAIIGETASERFEKLSAQYGWSICKATVSQDMYEHFDHMISRHNELYRVDVKARKRQSRHGNFTDLIWVELRGVNNSRGWLFGGHADLIAFEFEDGFRIAKRKDIIEFICTLRMPRTNTPRDALYKVYSRKGRMDAVTMIRPSDIYYFMTWKDYSPAKISETVSLPETVTSV